MRMMVRKSSRLNMILATVGREMKQEIREELRA